MTVNNLKKLLRSEKNRLSKEFGVKALYVFGSVAREEADSSSDIDIIVNFGDAETGLFEFIRLKDFLEELLGSKVDLVTERAIKKPLAAKIKADAIRVA